MGLDDPVKITSDQLSIKDVEKVENSDFDGVSIAHQWVLQFIYLINIVREKIKFYTYLL
ncbi:hypothetical protein [Niallia sp. FSL W8-0954]|uniref:hypothetical protein n=1 Tax=Niallia sp. FSL W8-0954 TaxID=2975338 RepID=UPI0030F8ACE3